jgi:hypothetical protein
LSLLRQYTSESATQLFWKTVLEPGHRAHGRVHVRIPAPKRVPTCPHVPLLLQLVALARAVQ